MLHPFLSLSFLAGVQAIEIHRQNVIATESSKLVVAADAANLSALIVYASTSGSTAALADVVAAGARAYPESIVRVADVSELLTLTEKETAALLTAQDAIILGSGVYNGDASYLLLDWLQVNWPKTGSIDLSWVLGNAFCTCGGANTGGTDTLQSMYRAMATFQVSYAGGTSWRSSQGSCAVVGKDLHGACAIDAEDRKLAYYLGYRTMMLAKAMAKEKAIVRASGSDPFDYANRSRPRLTIPLPPASCNSSNPVPPNSPSASPPPSPNCTVPIYGECGVSAGGACCTDATMCFKKNQFYSQCLTKCPADKEWECDQ